jgi:4-amino-4-deoxy-L-arabinose transferase-like glycosyltransferase
LIAAFHPLLIGADGALMSETLYGLLIAFVLIAAYRTLDQPTVRRAVVLGLVVGLCALTRAEALLLVPLLTLPVAWRADRWRRRLALIGAGFLATVVVVAPWTARNWSAFGQPVLISTNDGPTVAGANCAAAYHGRDLGSFRTDCLGPIASPDNNEARQADRYRSQGLSYARDHAGRLPMVMVVRVLRVWGLYQPTALTFDAQNRSHAVATAGVGLSYLLIPFAVVGAVLIRRRREPLFVLLAPVLLVTITCALTYGGLRFRHAAEIPLVVLAATGVLPVWKRATRRAGAARSRARRRGAGGRSRRASGPSRPGCERAS